MLSECIFECAHFRTSRCGSCKWDPSKTTTTTSPKFEKIHSSPHRSSGLKLCVWGYLWAVESSVTAYGKENPSCFTHLHSSVVSQTKQAADPVRMIRSDADESRSTQQVKSASCELHNRETLGRNVQDVYDVELPFVHTNMNCERRSEAHLGCPVRHLLFQHPQTVQYGGPEV